MKGLRILIFYLLIYFTFRYTHEIFYEFLGINYINSQNESIFNIGSIDFKFPNCKAIILGIILSKLYTILKIRRFVDNLIYTC